MVDVKRFKGAIFDMDGVIVDTEPVYREHVLMFFREHGVELSLEDVNCLAGMANDTYERKLREWWRAGTGRDAADNQVDELLDEFYARHPIDYRSIMNEGVPETLAWLRSRGIRCALASSSAMDDIRKVLTACGLEDAFDHIASGTDFDESKPNPAIYLHMLEALELPAEACFAVEDSDAGMAAARGAGIYVIGKRDDRFGYNQDAADVLIDKIGDLIP